MKRKLAVRANRPLADFLPTLTVNAKDFASELTSRNVVEKDLKCDGAISNDQVDNNIAVRKMLKERGVQQEQLPAAEAVKKVKRKLENEENKENKVVKGIKK